MGKTIRASLLILLLSCSAQAGYMPNGSPGPPPQPVSVAQSGYIPNESPAQPQPTSAPEEQTANGWMPNEAAAGLTQLTLDLFAVLPSLL